jgi:hypothetical protein
VADVPRARSDLEISRQTEGEREFVVVKDPRSRRFFRMRPPEWWLVEQFNGLRTPDEVGAAFEAKFGSRLETASLAAFIQRLETLNVLETDRAEKASSALSKRQGDSGIGRLLFIKLKAINPDGWLNTWARRLRFLFRPWFWPASLLLIVSALVIVARYPADFQFSLAAMLTTHSIPLLVFTIFIVISLHEVAHGLTCRHLGGQVHEMGFLLLYFQPCLYCDLSDAWMFPERWKKLLVTFAGAYFQVVLGAVGVWGWRITVPGTWLNDLFWLMAVVSLFNVLFNFNPLIKLDGYYMLSDGLRIPNLRTRAFGWLGHRLLNRTWSYANAPDTRERRIYWWYGVSALLYSVALVGYLVHASASYTIDRWRGPGLVLYLLLAAVMFRKPLGRLTQAVVPEALFKVRTTISWILAGLTVVAALLIPYQYRVGSPARIEPWAQLTISLLADGYVKTEWYDGGSAELAQTRISKLVASGFTTLNLQPRVSVGDSVNVGDTVLQIAADQFAAIHDESQSALRAKEAELSLLLAPPKKEAVAKAEADVDAEESVLTQNHQALARVDSLYQRNLIPKSEWESAQAQVRAQEARLEGARQELALLLAPPKPEAVEQLRAEIDRLRRQVQFNSGQLESTVFTSPVTGIVLRLAGREDEVCRIARLDSVRCVMDVSEADAPLLQSGQDVTLKVRSEPFESYPGSLAYVAGMGDTASARSTFSAVAFMANPGGLAPGATGYGKVAAGKHTFAWRVARTVARFVRIEFWSWW